MKIICSSCKKLMGEQKPFESQSEIGAKCADCAQKEKGAEIERVAKEPLPGSKKQRVVELENGLKGLITIGGKETPDLSFWDVLFGEKQFFCCEDKRKEFDGYLNSLPGYLVDITFLHSMEAHLDLPKHRKRKKLNDEEPKAEEVKRESINYNCTIRVPKEYAVHVFETKTRQNMEIVGILAEGIEKQYWREKEAEKAAASPSPSFDVGL